MAGDMTILHHLTAPPPRVAGSDAVFQEVELLTSSFGGEAINRYPFETPSRFWPKQLYGLHNLRAARALEARAETNHIWFAILHPFTFLRFLDKPIVYSVIARLQATPPPPSLLRRLRLIVVNNERDKTLLDRWGVRNSRLIAPGIAPAFFRETAPPADGGFTLLAASAPWTRGQIRSKGWEALVEVARRTPDLRLILLLRGWLAVEITNLVADRGISSRVEVFDGEAAVGALLDRSHAAVVLAGNERLVKAWPHSLLEAMAVGRPALVSRAIPMAGYVEAQRCGAVAENLDPAEIARAIAVLRDNYASFRANAAAAARRDFDQQRMLSNWSEVYAECRGVN